MDLSSRDELRPIADTLAIVSDAARKLAIRWFVVGAAARDLVLSFGYGIQTSRMTRDVDIAVNVESWDAFNSLTTVLLEHREVRRDDAVGHRFYFGSNVAIDVVPFGPIMRNGVVQWPADEDR